MARTLVSALAGAALAASCTTRLPTPALGPHPTADCATAVPSPPPESAQVEEVGTPGAPGQVWIDGHWRWMNQRWEWQRGSWQVPPPGAYFARPMLIRIPVAVYGDADGGTGRALKGYAMALMAYPGHWHLPSGQVVTAVGTSTDAGADTAPPAAR